MLIHIIKVIFFSQTVWLRDNELTQTQYKRTDLLLNEWNVKGEMWKLETFSLYSHTLMIST